jgi:hypothetical protein
MSPGRRKAVAKKAAEARWAASHPRNEKEYLRRNLLHAKAVGAHANATAALERVRRQEHPSLWIIRVLEGIIERTRPVADEMAKHRDEMW